MYYTCNNVGDLQKSFYSHHVHCNISEEMIVEIVITLFITYSKLNAKDDKMFIELFNMHRCNAVYLILLK